MHLAKWACKSVSRIKTVFFDRNPNSSEPIFYSDGVSASVRCNGPASRHSSGSDRREAKHYADLYIL